MSVIEKLKKFVYDHTREHDSSRYYEHIKEVYEISMTICTKLEEERGLALPINIIKWVTIVAWLYNVPDYNDGKKHVRYFLHDCAPDHSADLMTCIDSVSFSREKKDGKEYYNHFLTPEFQLVRNIVSDAARLKAVYTKQENKTPVSEEQIFLNIIVDCNEKRSK